MSPRPFLCLLLGALTLSACGQSLFPRAPLEHTDQLMSWTAQRYTDVKAYADVRFGLIDTKNAWDQDVLRGLTFNRSTQWPAQARALSEQVMENGGNPGLGLRELHAQGVTGSGVSVAIIDQNLAGDHPEFARKIVQYVDLGCEQAADSGSMHGPAVTSLLVGTNLGTAPGATVYYYAVPSWKADSEYYARALDQIVQQNAKLPAAHRIRAVSVSAAPSGRGSPFTKNTSLWDQAVRNATAAGILVLDCTADNGFVGPGYYDPARPESLEAFVSGWPGENRGGATSPTMVFAPSSFRTVAEEYVRDEPSYQYTGRGGLSWAIPYVTGVAALAWQVNPNLTSAQMKDLLLSTAYRTQAGVRVVDAKALVQAARATAKSSSS